MRRPSVGPMAKHPEGWDEKYTDPDLRGRLKDEVQADDKGG